MDTRSAIPSASRRGAGEKGTAGGAAAPVESWTVEIPFQHVFVEARACEEKLQPETAMDFIEDELRLLCRVRVREVLCGDSRTMCDVSVWRLRATCPFCKAGRDQVLDSRNWVYIHDWWREEIDATVQSEDEYIQEHAMEARFITGDATPAKLLLDAFFLEAIEKWGEAGVMPTSRKRNAYGISLAATRKSVDGQLSLHMPEVGLKSVTYGAEGYFGGLYRCPHCGGVFAAVYRDRHQRRRLGKYELLSYFDAGIDELIHAGERQRRHAASSSNPDGLLPTMTAYMERSGDIVSLEANIAGRWHRIEFNTKIGNFLLDDSTYVGDSFWSEELLENPLVKSGIFGSCEVVELLSGLLPSLPDGVGFSYGSMQNFCNLQLLIIANRFIGYPAAFYEEAKNRSALDDVYPMGSNLPRDYAEMPKLYEMTGLPDKKSLKRLLYAKPALLRELLGVSNLPFRNIDMLRRFLERPDASRLLRLLNIKPMSCAGWRWLATVKGERAVFDYLANNTPEAIVDFSVLLDSAVGELKDYAQDCVAGISMGELEKVLACQKWQREHPDMDLDASYAYDVFAEGLELDAGKYAFVLPRSPRDFVLASVELRNCLSSPAYIPPKPEKTIIVLMKEKRKFVAGLEVGHDGTVITALAKCNRPIAEHDDLNAAVGEWAARKSLLIAIDDKCGIYAF